MFQTLARNSFPTLHVSVNWGKQLVARTPPCLNILSVVTLHVTLRWPWLSFLGYSTGATFRVKPQDDDFLVVFPGIATRGTLPRASWGTCSCHLLWWTFRPATGGPLPPTPVSLVLAVLGSLDMRKLLNKTSFIFLEKIACSQSLEISIART